MVVAFCCVEDVALGLGYRLIAAYMVFAASLGGSAFAAVETWGRRTCGVAVVGRGLGRWEGVQEAWRLPVL